MVANGDIFAFLLQTACQQFGHVVRCELMTDSIGRSYGEAEVEFANKSAALDCIAKLDNEVADGNCRIIGLWLVCFL